MLSTAFCVALLAAAAGAFALTEGAKTTLSPIYGTKIDKVFSPTCNPHVCARRVAEIAFKIRSPEHLDVWMIDAHGTRVATILAGRFYQRGTVRLVFTGHTASGALLHDGPYVPVVRLVGDHRTITLPNVIELDTKAPTVLRYPHQLRALLAPGAVGRAHVLRFPYLLSGAAHAILFADGHRVALTYRQRPRGALQWNGTIDRRAVAPGTYTLEIAAQDEAGNRSRPIVFAHVRVAYLELSPAKLTLRPRVHFTVTLPVRPARVSWLFAGARGVSSAARIHLRAPRKRGRYTLFVHAGGHAASVLVVVR